MGVDYRLLGRLEVARDGVPVDLGAFRQRALLALLLAHAGTVLSTDRILDELWGPSAGGEKQRSLWVYVSGLRAALEPARAKRSDGTILVTRAPGYVLAVERDDTDVGRFEQLTAEARVVVESDPATAAQLLRTALAMWRGHAYEEFAYESWAQHEIARLEELRLEAVELRVEADLRCGRGHELVSELQSLTRQHPLRERFVRSLMLALYRSGRAAEALRACASFRERLVAELGIEPSRMVRELEHRILVDDGDLLGDRPGTPQRLRSGLTVRGYELREELGRGTVGTVFRAYQPVVGRQVAIKVVRSELADDPAFVRRFEAEAQLVAGLEHAHIVPLYDYWREPGAAYLVMRLVGTGTLADAVVDGALPPERAATVLGQVASALHFAHRHGVVHGDVSASNILVDGEGNAYLSDFGVAGPPQLPAGGPASVAGDIERLAAVAAVALCGLPGEYEQVRGALTPAVRRVLDRASAEDATRGYADVVSFARALTEAIGAPPDPDVAAVADLDLANPYKGLRAFGPADADDFCGRERLVERLIARLGEPGTRGRFVAVVGPSGSGKSSVVGAGLLPALAHGALPMSAEWFRVSLTPAPHPFEELEAALLRVASQAPNALGDVLLAPGGLRRAVAAVLPDDHSQLLLVVDQFEELFTQVDDATAARFLDELVDAVTAPGTRIRLVVTLRADFYDRPLRHRGIGELLREGTEVITPMSIDELTAAITEPAARIGVDVEPAAVSEMVNEIVDRPGALPLLQYALTELFEGRSGRTITAAAYRAGGGVSRPLARRADAIVAGLGPQGAATVRRVLLRLVSLDEDAQGAPTRRRALVAEVSELDDRLRVHQVLDTFGRHRLLSFDRDPVTRGPTVEISHEALLTGWTTLRDWIEDAREDLRTHRHLAGEMQAWTAADRSDGYLLRGARLDAVAAWAATTTMGLRADEHEFLDASLAARAASQRARQEEERRTISAEQRARRRTRQLIGAALVVAIVGALASFAWLQRQDARRAETDLADFQDARRLVNVSLTTLDGDPELALLLAMEAVRSTADLGYAVPEAIDAVHWSLQELGVQYDVAPDTPTATRYGPGGVRGIWVLPVDELMDLAATSASRRLSDAECERYIASAGCPAPASLAGVDYLDGVDAYAGAVSGEQPELVVAIGSGGFDTQAAEWERNLASIGEQHGIRIRTQQVPINLSPTEAAAQGFEADVFHLVSPGELPAFAASRPLLDLRPFVDEGALATDYGEHVVALSRIGDDGTWPSATGPIHAVMIGADSKALVWTKEPTFTDLGYREPTDWGSFLALGDAIAADGRTPLCLELAAQDTNGWAATDWVEMVVLRRAGPDFYDSWIAHEVAFDDPQVVDAIRTVGEMVYRPGFLDATPSAVALRGFGAGLAELVDDVDGCLMTPFPSFLPGILGAAQDLPVGTFPFPTFGAGHDDAVVGGGGFAVAVTDRPEVRTLMAALASPEWGLGASGDDWQLLAPANTRFDAAVLANPVMTEIVTGIQDAIRTGNYRFDASDAMPTDVADAFLDGMVRLFREGSADTVDALALDIARDVEATWQSLEAAGG